MGRFSLEFGRKGPEGLSEEHDEGIIGGAASQDEKEEIDVKKILDDLDSTPDDDFEDCKKEKDFLKELAKLMNDDEEIDEYYDDCEKEKALEEAEKEMDRLKAEIDEIFG